MATRAHNGWKSWRRGVAWLALLVIAGGTAVISTPTPALAAGTDSVAIGPGKDTDQRVLQIVGTANGSRVAAVNYRVGATGTDIDNQRWVLDLQLIIDIEVTPIYEIRNVLTGKCLTKASSNVNNAAVTIQPCTDTIYQRWTVPYGGTFQGTQIQSMADNRCLDLTGGSTSSGALVRASNCGSSNWYQRWRLRYGAFHCDRNSTQRLLTGLCVNIGEQPMFGLFGTFRNQPISFGADATKWPNTLVNFIEVRSLNSQLVDSAPEDGVELGLHVSYDTEAGRQDYFPYWVEWGESKEEYHGISNTPNGSTADGRLHHYLLLSNDDNTEWDVLYDYNTVATTRLQEGAIFREAYAITSVVTPHVVKTSEPFENRLQVWDGNQQWRRPRLDEISRSEPKSCYTLPTDVDPVWQEFNVPPSCMTTSLGTTTSAGTTEVQYLRIGKPNSLMALPLAPHLPEIAETAVFNGVDQKRLWECLATQSNPCMDTVPGLRTCVKARKICNADARSTPSRRRTALMTAEQARKATARLLTVEPTQSAATMDSRVVSTTAAKLDPALRASVSVPAISADTPLNVVAGHGIVSSLGGDADRRYEGYTLVFDATTANLLYACLGRQCTGNRVSGAYR